MDDRKLYVFEQRDLQEPLRIVQLFTNVVGMPLEIAKRSHVQPLFYRKISTALSIVLMLNLM